MKIKVTLNIFLILLLLLVAGSLAAQETVVAGQVLSSDDKSPIPNVNISFKNSVISAESNEEGYFLIRTNGRYNTLVFSSIGYKTREIKIKPGQSVGMQVELHEENTLLREVFIVPGSNPALEIMKKVKLLKSTNDLSRQKGFNVQGTEQNLVLLSKINQRSVSKRIFDQLKKGNLSGKDTMLIVPLYMAENKYQITSTAKKQVSNKVFSSPVTAEKIVKKLVGEMETELNFYDNSITVFGKNMISPLSSVGNAYYNFYLADSTSAATGKQYVIHFRTKNTKNLAFDGKLWIDSTTFAMTRIEAELPEQANINFIHNLRISQIYVPDLTHHWMRQSEEVALNMNYYLLTDSLHPKPEIFVKRSTTYVSKGSYVPPPSNFAKSNFDQTTLNDRLNTLNNTPLLRTAKWIADIVITGNIATGIFNIGKVEQFIRITDIEGLRLTLPVHTNENLWKNVSLGGYIGYGFKNESVKYSGEALYKFKGDKRRILSMNYTDDYRRIDYNYNDFMIRENPLITGDEDIASTLIGFESAEKINERKEYSMTFENDWNQDIESKFIIRSNKLFANQPLPMELNGISATKFLQQQSATVSTRFSFDERTYDVQMQRIYISNNLPVIYGIAEAGKYQFGNKSGNYGKMIVNVKQFVRFDIGLLNYKVDAGIILGNVPYPLLGLPPGNESGGYGFYQFNLMNYMEYAADKYVNLHSEFMSNGWVMNQIPLIKNLNLREMVSFKMAYGSLSNSHRAQLDFPVFMNPLSKPYMEVGAGFTNILHIFTLQYVRRLTDLNHRGISSWGILGCLNLSL